jgi:cytidylate kinase
MSGIIIAIDGHSSSGKSTLAKALSKSLGYTYIDSGAMYRAVSLYALNHNFIDTDRLRVDSLISDLENIQLSFVQVSNLAFEICLNGKNVESEIRGMEVSNCVSLISAIPEVRALLVAQQRIMGYNKSLVMDGRDIGSVVFPDAELKLFVTASEQVRAQRRYNEIREKSSVSLQEIKANLKDRDFRDMNRENAPLIQVSDAIIIDNTNLNQAQQLEMVLNMVDEIIHPS